MRLLSGMDPDTCFGLTPKLKIDQRSRLQLGVELGEKQQTRSGLIGVRGLGLGARFKFRGSGCGLGRFHFYILIVSDHLITLKMFKSLIDFL